MNRAHESKGHSGVMAALKSNRVQIFCHMPTVSPRFSPLSITPLRISTKVKAPFLHYAPSLQISLLEFNQIKKGLSERILE